MCGLVTIIAKRQWGFNSKDLDMFEELLTVDQLRGQDATGAFCVHKSKQVSGIKGAFTPWHLFKQPEYRTFRDKAVAQGRILVGHNRKATHGAGTNPTNAHPFVEDNIILVHNGTLYNHKKLADRDVDSHAVAAAFSQGKYDEVLADINGAYVFIWWDMKRNQLSMVRNKERPLWKLENDDYIVLCSEAWMGLGVARRNNVGTGQKDSFDITEVPPAVIHHFEIGGELVEEEGVKKAQAAVTPSNHTANTSHGTPSGKEQTKDNSPTSKPSTNDTATSTATKGVSPRGPQFPFAKAPFKEGERVLVQLTKTATVDVKGDTTFNAMGFTVEPGCPVVDARGVLPSFVSHDTVDRWMMYPVTAVVSSYRETTNGGPIIGLKDFEMEPLTQVWPTGVIAESEWEHVTGMCSCKHCSGAIPEYESAFTSVKISSQKGVLKYEVTCADCIELKIVDKEVKNEFTEGRINAIQEWESKQRRIAAAAQRATQVSGNSTSH